MMDVISRSSLQFAQSRYDFCLILLPTCCSWYLSLLMHFILCYESASNTQTRRYIFYSHKIKLLKCSFIDNVTRFVIYYLSVIQLATI